MPKYLTIGYGDEAGYKATDPAVIRAAHENDEALSRAGAITGIAGVPMQVRNHDAAGVETERGPYLTSALPLAGFSLIEARDMDEAIAMVAKSPCAVAKGVIEIWPLE